MGEGTKESKWRYSPEMADTPSIPEGDYILQVKSRKAITGRESGVRWGIVTLEVLDVPGFTVDKWFNLDTADGTKQLKKFAEALGTCAVAEFTAKKFDPENYVGSRVGAALKIDKKDASKMFVFYFKPAGQVGAPPPGAAEAAKAWAGKQQQAPTGGGGGADDPGHINPDDIPF